MKLGSTEGTGTLEEFTDTRELLDIAYDSHDHWIRRYNQQGSQSRLIWTTSPRPRFSEFLKTAPGARNEDDANDYAFGEDAQLDPATGT